MMNIPVNIGDVVDLKIEALGRSYDGIGKVDGFVVFVPKTILKNTYRVKITDVKKNYAFGEVYKGEN